MQTESSIAQSPEVMFKGRWVKVEVYAPTHVLTHICTGHVFCLEGRRLLDHLNDVFPTTVSEEKDFLSMKEVEMYSPRREKGETLRFTCLNKHNILFVRELEEDQTPSIVTKLGHKGYPYVNKSSMRVRLHLPFYVLNGHMHRARGERMSDVLNVPLRFLPLTNAEICPSVGKSKLVSFIAVNKCQIILAQDFADSETEEARLV